MIRPVLVLPVLMAAAAISLPFTTSAQPGLRGETAFGLESLECHPKLSNAGSDRIALVNKGRTVPGGTAVTITYREKLVLAPGLKAKDASTIPTRTISHRLQRSLGTGAVEVLGVSALVCLSATYQRAQVLSQ